MTAPYKSTSFQSFLTNARYDFILSSVLILSFLITFCFVLIDWQASFFAACGPLLAQIEPTKEPDSPGLLQKLAERVRYFRKKNPVDHWMQFIHKFRLELFVNDQWIIRIVKIFSLISLIVSKSLHNNIFICVLYVLCCFYLTGQPKIKSWRLGH